MTLHLFCVQNLKKKKDRPTDSPDFQAKRANKPFIFLGRMSNKLLKILTETNKQTKNLGNLDTLNLVKDLGDWCINKSRFSAVK